ncbi:hypothetical protein LCGC14_0563020 [marine sediment metagenome]|uniref:Uncharacterized protein n=1 Tax=marine sediment metagenome TaxID=412755 RepID=A0A0F9RRR1_9ZZZZ|nr:hypothetical protein [Phycisphaerae bacterium]
MTSLPPRPAFAAALILIVTAGAFAGSGPPWLITGGPAAASPAGGGGLHIAGNKQTGFNWTRKDGGGFRWDITNVGMVLDGTSDLYDGAMRLSIGPKSFTNSRPARLNAAGNEIEIGPWTNGPLRVWRRIYVDPDTGYCRWIDIFENQSDTPLELPVRYNVDFGGTLKHVISSSDKPLNSGDAWALVTQCEPTDRRMAVAHILASPESTIKPTLTSGGRKKDLITYTFALKLQPRQTSALCIVHVQRRALADARAIIDGYDLRQELDKIPPKLAAIIVNLSSSGATLAGIGLPRNRQHDLVVLPDKTRLKGTIRNELFQIETTYGTFDLPADRVIGFGIPDPNDPHVHLVLTDGQILGGRLLSGPVNLEQENGATRSIALDRLASAAFAISPEKPVRTPHTDPIVELRGGQRLTYGSQAPSLRFHSEYGPVDLPVAALTSLEFHTPDGGLHRAILANGTILSGLLADDELTLQLKLGRQLVLPVAMAKRLLFPVKPAADPALWQIHLHNENVLFGRVMDEQWTVQTPSGSVSVALAEVARLTRPQDRPTAAPTVTLQSGNALTGELTETVLHIELADGLVVPVFLGHVRQILAPRTPAPAPAPTTAPTSAPATRPATLPRPTTLDVYR